MMAQEIEITGLTVQTKEEHAKHARPRCQYGLRQRSTAGSGPSVRGGDTACRVGSGVTTMARQGARGRSAAVQLDRERRLAGVSGGEPETRRRKVEDGPWGS